MSNDESRLRSVVLAGHFDPATIAKLLPATIANRISGLRSAPGVPLHSLAQGISSRGIPTTLLGGIRGSKRLYLQSDPLSVAIYPKRGGWPFLLNGLSRERNALLEFLREIDPSVVHAHWTLEAGRAAADWHGPKVLTVHDTAWEYARLGWRFDPLAVAFTARWLRNTAETLRRFRHVIAVSPYVETYLRLKHRFRGEIRVIPNAIPELPSNLVPPLSHPKGKLITFGCYGPPGGIKNVDAAVSAFRMIEGSLPNTRLLVFGAGWEKAKQGLESARIEFRGALPHADFLRTLVEQVDVWVHPARIEMHPIAICEALQAGCPVIAGQASGGVAWTLDYGNAGMLVDIENPKEIGRAMRETVLDWKASMQRVAYGQRMIREQLNQDRIVDLHLAYYRDLINAQ